MVTLQQIVILVLEISVGYGAAKRGKIPQSAVGVLNFLCCNIALPCAIIYPIIHLENSPAVWIDLSKSLVVIIILTALQVAFSQLLFRRTTPGSREVLRMGTFSTNTAFMGIPLMTAIMGNDGVIYATLMVIIDTVVLFTYSSMAVPGKKLSVTDVIRKIFGVATVSMIIGLVILFSGIEMPGILITCMNDFRGMMTPLAMVIVGCQLAKQDFKKIFQVPRYYEVAVIKLLAVPAALAVLLKMIPTGIPGIAAAAIVICKATPQAAVLGVIAGNNGLDDECASAIVGVTTILSVITLPLVAAAAVMIF